MTEGRAPRFLSPPEIAAPLAHYTHGVEIPEGARLVKTAGQLGRHADGKIPGSVKEQAEICFQNILAILREAGMTSDNIIHISGYLVDRSDMPDYMSVRDEVIGTDRTPPTSTLLIVSGFSRPEYQVEVEVWAADVTSQGLFEPPSNWF
jgi:enamine deaminase RidA (YjgF/YER057c/UK114 family)